MAEEKNSIVDMSYMVGVDDYFRDCTDMTGLSSTLLLLII